MVTRVEETRQLMDGQFHPGQFIRVNPDPADGISKGSQDCLGGFHARNPFRGCLDARGDATGQAW